MEAASSLSSPLGRISISHEAVAQIVGRVAAEAYGVATFYALFATTARPPIVAHVCDDLACRLAGSEQLCADLERTMGPAGTSDAAGERTWLRSPCLGLCERAPAAMITRAGTDAATTIARIIERSLAVSATSSASMPAAMPVATWPPSM